LPRKFCTAPSRKPVDRVVAPSRVSSVARSRTHCFGGASSRVLRGGTARVPAAAARWCSRFGSRAATLAAIAGAVLRVAGAILVRAACRIVVSHGTLLWLATAACGGRPESPPSSTKTFPWVHASDSLRMRESISAGLRTDMQFSLRARCGTKALQVLNSDPTMTGIRALRHRTIVGIGRVDPSKKPRDKVTYRPSASRRAWFLSIRAKNRWVHGIGD
jgi:hypothetical protein